jgi:proprotein convertase subtilisin/kexin type 2
LNLNARSLNSKEVAQMCFNTTKLMHSVLLLASLFLTACGGGGGSASPPTPPPAAPKNVVATPGDGYVLLNGDSVAGATAYNIYWSTTPTPAVSKANGTKLAATSTPQAHTGLTNGTTYYYVVTAVGAGGESVDSVQASAKPVLAPVVLDPLYGDQWHLKNTGQQGAGASPGLANEDMNVEPAWASNYKGNGIRIAVVDEGLEIGHEDLAANVAANDQSHNYLTGSSDPTNDPADVSPGNGHGTAVAGIAAARDLNGLGGRGAAPRANLVGYNLLQNQTAFNEADAMTRGLTGGLKNVDIYTNSWGFPDGNGTLDAPSVAWRSAIDTGLASGRGGLGAIYTWAAGNGAPTDNSNYDGYANYRGVIAVAAVNDQGKQSSYSESGANVWVSAPGGEFCDTHAITTTDRTGAVGENPPGLAATYTDYSDLNYTKCMNGTSSATPGVAGVIALMLQAKPTLGWRDVREILARTGRVNDNTDPGWFANGYGYSFNHKYGFGVVDANLAVTMAAGWTNITGPQKNYTPPPSSPGILISDGTSPGVPGAAVPDTITVTGSGIASIEFVEITFSSDHTYSGDLAITLTSPALTVSRLAETHACKTVCTVYSGWVFGSAAHLGEAADGAWILTVQDGSPVGTGTFQSWGLKFYGR